ncbi:MAG TPA: hypothetical protein PK323_08590 [Bacteroidia bacterium]|nr:hypothetical protein [Bacteroidia bacterium]
MMTQSNINVSKKYIFVLLIVIVFGDLIFSFFQHLAMPLDGDMAGGIVPAEDVKPILKDPFGITVFTQNLSYPNPNRFFAHFIFYTYFNYVPKLLQHWCSPIQSVYLSCALAKVIIQLGLITVIGIFVTRSYRIFSYENIIAMALLTPLFQTNGYRSYMGIIDTSITYTFFYALPTLILMLFYLPFYFKIEQKQGFLRFSFTVFSLAFGIITVFNGPLNIGIIVIVTALYALKKFQDTTQNKTSIQYIILSVKNTPLTRIIVFAFVCLLSFYAFYLGKFNTIFIGENLSILDRYLRLPKGVYFILFQKIGFPLLLLAITINIVLLHKNKNKQQCHEALALFKWLAWFCLLYLLMLPLGGYKEYRPYIIRFDTFMPVTITLFFIYVYSTFMLIQDKQLRSSNFYLLLPMLISLVFFNADKGDFHKNDEEKAALNYIAMSKENIVQLKHNCTIISWNKINDPQKSALNGELLLKWGIINKHKLYYQK